MQLTNLASGVGHLKAGFLGFAGSGKTYTATLLAIALRKRLGLKGPIGLFDTEAAAQYVAPLVKRETGLDLVGFQSRSFQDSLDFLTECQKLGVSVAIIDSVTHTWKSLCDDYLAQRNEARARQGKNPSNRLEFQDWATIKGRWAKFSDSYLNVPMHTIICGRAGYEWDFEAREDGVGKDLVKTGIKMKAEGDFGFEPSLLVQMERVSVESASAKLTSAKYVRRASVIKDRFGVIDGLECDNPDGAFFAPYIEMLVPGAHAQVDLTRHTDMGVDESGDAEWAREKRQRQIASENLAGALIAVWPGQGAQEKLARQEVVHKVLGTRSWSEVENTNADKLKAAIACLPTAIEEVKKELADREAQEAAKEAEAKAAKKSKPEKAEVK